MYFFFLLQEKTILCYEKNNLVPRKNSCGKKKIVLFLQNTEFTEKKILALENTSVSDLRKYEEDSC